MDLKNIVGSQPGIESSTAPNLMDDLSLQLPLSAVERVQNPSPLRGFNIHNSEPQVASLRFFEEMRGAASSAFENVAHVMSYSEEVMEGIESTGAWWHEAKQQGLTPYISAVSHVDAGVSVASEMLKEVNLPSSNRISKGAGLLNATFGVLDVAEAVHKDKMKGDRYRTGTLKEITKQVGMNTVGGAIGFAAASFVAGSTTIALAPIAAGVVVGVGAGAAVRAAYNWMFQE
jgi:hypothetical protein